MEHGNDDDNNCSSCTWNNPQSICKGTGKLGNKRTSGDYPDYSIIQTMTI